MKVLIAGKNGQLAWELQRSKPDGVDCLALGSAELDISREDQVRRQMEEFRPRVVINAAAYTAVDKAESESQRAFAVNRDGAAHLAAAARDLGARLIQVSTDFVFDGLDSRPYLPAAKAGPTGVYGASKLAGEKRVKEITRDYVILRTAWVYSAHGSNFVKTMLRLMAERSELGVVADQIGTPTWAWGLARAIWQMSAMELSGVYHWTDAGAASWYDFACAIHDEARELGLLTRDVAISPIATSDYPTPAQRPPYSVLDKTSTWKALDSKPQHWRHALRKMLLEIKNG